MAAKIMDGRVLREKLLPEIRRYAQDLRDHHHCVPTLAAILVGEDAASRQYVKNKQKMAADLGFHSRTITMAEWQQCYDEVMAINDHCKAMGYPTLPKNDYDMLMAAKPVAH